MYSGLLATPKYATTNGSDSSHGSTFSGGSLHSSAHPEIDKQCALQDLMETVVQVSWTLIDIDSSVLHTSLAILGWDSPSTKFVVSCIESPLASPVVSCTGSHSPIPPPPPYQSHQQRRGGFGGVVKQAKIDSGIQKKAQLHTASFDDPFLGSPHLGSPLDTASSFSIPTLALPSHSTPSSPSSMFTMPHLPLPSHTMSPTSQYPSSKGPMVPGSSGSSLDMPPSNQCHDLSISLTSLSLCSPSPLLLQLHLSSPYPSTTPPLCSLHSLFAPFAE
ncbi:hypothetical protein JB92DRAFT_3125217 [Gautieria morchelliformis]|nr:hypothetical protein JB92DRAFT_3125217 [Gautieria morchelliformis]